MKTVASANSSSENERKASLKRTITQWMAELTSFRQNYYRLEKHVGQQLNDLCMPRLNVTRYATQCPMERLIALQITMRTELERLLTDMEAEGGPPKDMVKLKAHTRQLRYLNQQAQTQLLLTSTSVS